MPSLNKGCITYHVFLSLCACWFKAMVSKFSTPSILSAPITKSPWTSWRTKKKRLWINFTCCCANGKDKRRGIDQDNPHYEMLWWLQAISLHLIILEWFLSSFVFCFTRFSISSIMQPHPTKVTQAVQLLQSGTPWCKYLLWLWRACRRYQETGWYTRGGRGGHRRATYQQQDHRLWYESRFTLSMKQIWKSGLAVENFLLPGTSFWLDCWYVCD